MRDWVIAQDVLSKVAVELERIAPLLDLTADLEESEKRLRPFVSSGFSMAPSIPKGLESQIQQLRNYTQTSVGRILLPHYSAGNWSRLAHTIEAWQANPFFKPRMATFRDSLWAVRSKRYRLAVATLIPQFEGIIWAWLLAFATLEERQQIINREKKLRTDLRRGKVDDSVWVGSLVAHTIGQIRANAWSHDQWTRIKTFVHFVKAELYEYVFLYGDNADLLTSRRLSRHVLAHVGGLGSGTRMNSLRLFLALDVLAILRPSEEGGN